MRRYCILVMACFALLGACSDSNSSSNNGKPLLDAGGDAGIDGGGDVGADADAGPASCTYQRDCPDGMMCHDSQCMPEPACGNASAWTTCVAAFEAIEPGLGRRAVCEDHHCQVSCLSDEDCGDGYECSDNGHCIAFTGQITHENPGGDARAPLKAGVSNVLMTFPIGLSQGGYGARAATNDGRYVKSLRSTDGEMQGLYARAFVLDNGERQIMFLRMPIIFPSMALHEALARKLQELTGKDWRDSLVITGTHTHSGPTRYWHLPPDAAVPLGSFGTDEFSQQVFDWTVTSAFSAAKQALDDLSPARFGWHIIEAFDTDDYISSDRWDETPPFDDNRLLIFRIDDADGNPRAVAISYGTHGTVHEKDYFTPDIPGGAERGLEKALAQKYGRFVPVMYFNENGGSMSPRGDHWGHHSTERFQVVGHELAQRAMQTIEDMQTDTDVELDAVTHRFPITYEYVGYGEGEWTTKTLGKGSPHDEFDFGGLQCMENYSDSDPSTHADPPIQTCVPIHFLNYHRPVTLFARSQMTALDIDGLTIVTLPGESTMEMGWQVLRHARDQYGIDPLKAWVMGYAQDHQFYLTPTNLRGEKPVFPGISTPKAPDDYPDYAFSYLQGGYEASLSVWGWKFGAFLVDRAMETVGMLEGAPVDSTLPATLPTQFSRVDEDPFPIDVSDASKVGDVVQQPPATAARFTPIEFAWVGGDPGAEMPQAPKVALEKKNGANFEAIQTKSMRPYDNREPVMMTRMRKAGDDWQWVVRWEEIKDFPAGQYRFHVQGHYLDDSKQRQAYELTSDTFEVTANDALEVSVSTDPAASAGPTISGTLGYPAGQPLSYEPTLDDPGKLAGDFRMRHPKVPLGQSAPLMVGEDVHATGVTVHVKQGSTEVATLTEADVDVQTNPETVDGRDGVPVTRYSAVADGLSSGTYDVEVDVTDAYGNTGTATGTITVP